MAEMEAHTVAELGEAPPTQVGAKIEPVTAMPDPFDPERLRLPQTYGAAAGVTKRLGIVPVRKPAKETFVRTHPDQAFRINTAVLELKGDREIYLVDRPLLEALAGESTVSPRLLITTLDRDKALSLWPLRLPGPDGKLDDWGRSALEAAKAAEDRWVRVTANMSAGCYDIYEASETLSQPEWPDVTLTQLLKSAFKDRFIADLDHIVLRKLRGEI